MHATWTLGRVVLQLGVATSPPIWTTTNEKMRRYHIVDISIVKRMDTSGRGLSSMLGPFRAVVGFVTA